MRSSIFSLQALVLLAATGCASSPAPATVTSAPAPPPRTTAAVGDAPAATPPAEPRVDGRRTVAETAEAPPGELVCRTTDAGGVAYALFLDGTTAHLRRVAPSGATEVRLLTVTRTDGMIVADVPGDTDLAAHAATVREIHGNRVMRVGNWNEPWLGCEK